MGHPSGVRLSQPAAPPPGELPAETARQRADRIYAASEASLQGYYATRRRRGPPILLATVLVLTLAVAIVVAVDLRRLQTPRGTALAWVGAAIFGGCQNYDELSVAAPGATPDPRSDRARCLALTRQTEANRRQAARITIDAGRVVQQGRRATVEMTVVRPDAGRFLLSVPLRRAGDGWVVVRTPAVCRAVACV